tara:strand:- start:7923 stop:8942 length:1020 start_codon:yes stop_codon:yes gene_type:complete
MKKVRARAPLRLGLGGGGTDISPYSDYYGGSVLNATINMYAYCTISERSESVIFQADDLKTSFKDNAIKQELKGDLILHKAVYNKVISKFNDNEFPPLHISTYCDAPPGSGLGSSSTLVVAMLKAFQEYFNLPLGEYDIANLAFEIERVDCNLSGGKQDQYCASFGGINFMEFRKNNNVIVNPLRIKTSILAELESSMILYFTGISRDSASIIDDQVNAISSTIKLNGLHRVKESVVAMKEYILKGDFKNFFELQKLAWEAKKETSRLISNKHIDKIQEIVMNSNAKAIKISGAGGGGFMMIFCYPEDKINIINNLFDIEGSVYNFNFSKEGAESWKVA